MFIYCRQGGGGDKKDDDEDKKPKQSAAGKALAERMARQREEEERIKKLEVISFSVTRHDDIFYQVYLDYPTPFVHYAG